MTYASLTFRRSDLSPIACNEARQMTALAANGAISPRIFARGSDGETINTPPRIVFAGGHGMIRIHGLGIAGSLHLMEERASLAKALYKQGFRTCEVQEGQMSMDWAEERPGLYNIGKLVVAKKPKHCGQYIRTALNDELKAKCAEIVLTGLSTLATMLDDELIEYNQKPTYCRDLPGHVEVLDGAPTKVIIRPGIWGAAYGGVLVQVPRKLNGPWCVGQLRSRGFGLMQRVNPTKPRRTA